jgi:hypothetical protein
LEDGAKPKERHVRSSLRLARALLVAASLVASSGAARADVAAAHVYMDEFTPSFQVLTDDAYARYFPMSVGGRSPTAPTRNWGGCAVLRLRHAKKLLEIRYVSTGNSGFSQVSLFEDGWGELEVLAGDYQTYPSASYEKTLLARTDDPIPLRKGYRYSLCVQGAPGTTPGDANQIDGFEILYRKRRR